MPVVARTSKAAAALTDAKLLKTLDSDKKLTAVLAPAILWFEGVSVEKLEGVKVSDKKKYSRKVIAVRNKKSLAPLREKKAQTY